ncbi:MAG: transglycosylase SLT domain-containing protein, partial [Actinomycetota bacterium]|nr:transglycosylase SLT domain-containing protein [Actinomycetota bacterium]
AILGAANYLHASGAPGDYRRALYAYNHSDAYVDAVLLYANRMKRKPLSYYGYYSWQVFVITTKGDVRLTGPAEPAGLLLRYYRRAERRFGVEWEVLAAVNYVETKFNRVRSSSSAGAQGPMQFLPSTWDAYGLGGDIHDPRDAILGAANYLHASGAPGDYRRALYAYNHSDAYVDAVLLYANRMKRRPHSYYGYYSWQVFVITTKGDVRLTGPGLPRRRS